MAAGELPSIKAYSDSKPLLLEVGITAPMLFIPVLSKGDEPGLSVEQEGVLLLDERAELLGVEGEILAMDYAGVLLEDRGESVVLLAQLIGKAVEVVVADAGEG